MSEEYQLELNSNEICRNCLAKSSELKSLFRCDIIDGEIWPIPKVYQNVTNIPIAENDNFPQNICSKCETSMFDAFMFKQKSVKSHNLMQKIWSNPEKNEVNPLPTDRISKSTQTQNVKDEEEEEEEEEEAPADEEEAPAEEEMDEDEDVTSEITGEFAVGSTVIKSMSVAEIIEQDIIDGDDDETSETWQMVYIANDDENEYATEELDTEQYEELDSENEMINDALENSNETTDCEHCGQTVRAQYLQTHFKQHAKLYQHLLTTHEFGRCSRCFRVFDGIESLSDHLNAEELCERSAELSKDDACTDYQYLGNDPPIRLFSTCKNDDLSSYVCKLCTETFDDVLSFFVHFEDKHLSNLCSNAEYMRSKLSHRCGICEKTFSNLQDALHHVYFHQNGYLCPYNECWKICDSFSLLYSHFTRGHRDDKIECSHCTFVAENNRELKHHQRNSCSARQFKCDLCEKTFYKKSTLNMHFRSHTNERRYACDMCPKAFLQSNDLANHVRTHTDERPFKCDLCDKSFKTIGQRIGHMSTHVTEHNFECDVCMKTFKSARILHGHKKIHGERQFQCDKCDKKFNRKYHLTLHMKRHEENRKTKRHESAKVKNRKAI